MWNSFALKILTVHELVYKIPDVTISADHFYLSSTKWHVFLNGYIYKLDKIRYNISM